jgi:hypothetical protein
MQENTEKPEDSDAPEKEENSSDVEETSESSEDESPFEEHEGEVLPAERKKQSGCGFLIFILLLLTGGGGYLYYTHQIPPQIMQWIEPLIGSQPKQSDPIARPPVVRPLEKSPVTLEEKTVFEESPSVVEESPTTIVSPPSIETEHISGSPTEPLSEPTDTNYLANISGNTTLVESDVEAVMEEPEDQERFVERAPVFSPPPSKPDQPEKNERNEAVQAYLDFVESVLVKIGELIKTGFLKGKDFLMQSIG